MDGCTRSFLFIISNCYKYEYLNIFSLYLKLIFQTCYQFCFRNLNVLSNKSVCIDDNHSLFSFLDRNSSMTLSRMASLMALLVPYGFLGTRDPATRNISWQNSDDWPLCRFKSSAHFCFPTCRRLGQQAKGSPSLGFMNGPFWRGEFLKSLPGFDKVIVSHGLITSWSCQ